jgi:hypothetical protein
MSEAISGLITHRAVVSASASHVAALGKYAELTV